MFGNRLVFDDGLFYPRSWPKKCALYSTFKQMSDSFQIAVQFSYWFLIWFRIGNQWVSHLLIKEYKINLLVFMHVKINDEIGLCLLKKTKTKTN